MRFSVFYFLLFSFRTKIFKKKHLLLTRATRVKAAAGMKRGGARAATLTTVIIVSLLTDSHEGFWVVNQRVFRLNRSNKNDISKKEREDTCFDLFFDFVFFRPCLLFIRVARSLDVVKKKLFESKQKINSQCII